MLEDELDMYPTELADRRTWRSLTISGNALFHQQMETNNNKTQSRAQASILLLMNVFPYL